MRCSIGICVLALAGCTTTLSQAGSGVVQADEKMVAACQFLGTVEGSSGFGNIAASTGMQNAKNQATEKAASMGATHIVITSVTGGYSPAAQGRAYRCKS